MTITTLTTAPTPPVRNDPDTFRDLADAYVAWQANTFVPELNTAIGAINIAITDINNDATLAEEAHSYTAAIVGAAWYNPATTYAQGDGAIGSNGYTYVSLINANTGNDPTSDDGTKWVRVTGPSPYQGTTTSSAVDITLVYTDPDMQSVSMTAVGKSVTLPDATTLRTGLVFTIFNTGANKFGIRNDAGTLLWTLPAGTSVCCYLSDISTAAGVWGFGQAVAIDRVLPSTPVAWESDASQTMQSCVTLDASTLILVYQDTDSDGYAVAISATDGSILDGPIEIYDATTFNYSKTVKLSATEAFVLCMNGTTDLRGIILSYTGGTLSVGEAATQIVNYNSAANIGCCALSATEIAVSSVAAGTVDMRIVTWSGGSLTVTSGPTTLIASAATGAITHLALSSTVWLVGCDSDDTLYVCKNTAGSLSVLDSEVLSAMTQFTHMTLLSEDANYWYVAINRTNSSTYYVTTVKIAIADGAVTVLNSTGLSNTSVPRGAACLNDKYFVTLTAVTGATQLETFHWSAPTLTKIDDYIIQQFTSSPSVWGYNALQRLTDAKVIYTYADADNSSYETTQTVEMITG